MKNIILLTGATGFLGTNLANRLIRDSQDRILALVRAVDNDHAIHRLQKEWWDFPELYSAIGNQVIALAGDITLPQLGLNRKEYQQLVEQLTHIIHSAADVRLFQSLEKLRIINVEGTRYVLELAQAAHADHGLQRFAHVSTAYVAGAHSGIILEEPPKNQFGFSSPYEQSKYEAELLIWQAKKDLPVTIFRPGMIVGDSKNGRIKSFNTLYYPLRLYLTEKLSIAPANPKMRVNLVPVDYVAEAISRLTFQDESIGQAFHLTPSPKTIPSISQVTDFSRLWAKENLGIHLKPARFIKLPGTKWLVKLAKNLPLHELSTIRSLLPYFDKDPLFDRRNTDQYLGEYPHQWQDLLPVLLQEAVQRSFWHRTTRSVHEQVIVRMQSKSKPIIYHDLKQGKITHRTGADMQEEIHTIRASFQALGIQSGERVAIIGVNSSRYFSILMACGLSGIISTPFYATCPPTEVNQLLAHSQPQLFLIGVPSLIQRIDELNTQAPLVSFCAQELPNSKQSDIRSWQSFLQLGENQSDLSTESILLDQPVSLHYTSGTTGEHKGVVYLHHHHRWLAETLASMFPWYERNRKGSYLSYLPMNHVVEGILATYSPYYVPAALDLYFLDEFNDLQWALQQVRPTIFFSVPRFFEKVRASFLENPLARYYDRLPEGKIRQFLKPILRRGLLKKVGLNKCKQIIVGSATTDIGLLTFFQDLGIEVHNAYGLTEAPLVSLNRLGQNNVISLGKALPETDIHIREDGEICVRGPQVAAGYFNNNQIEPFPDDWLETGDLGAYINGYLLMNGRKKDILITSYAKNIIPTMIEANLRAIPGISEALLVGDGRSYCIALLWLDESTWHAKSPHTIEAGIARINSNSARPEQIKRWVIMPDKLSAENGALTGSMKMRRGILTKRYSSVIDAVYNGKKPEGVIYSGGLPRE
ncbi:MAG: SDR family oxidoreductase [Anaerolineaceae bacterium]|nr:SDR family oxidoreductase [Anaerolineaceae bacterium]